MKTMFKVLAATAALAGVLAISGGAQARNPATQTIYANDIDTGWTTTVQADVYCAPGNLLCDPNDFVRGGVSHRSARDRLFYNTTSNHGVYTRWLHVECNGQNPQDDNHAYQTDSDGDMTLYCTGTSMKQATSFAQITSY
jgi:hypothetical protein